MRTGKGRFYQVGNGRVDLYLGSKNLYDTLKSFDIKHSDILGTEHVPFYGTMSSNGKNLILIFERGKVFDKKTQNSRVYNFMARLPTKVKKQLQNFIRFDNDFNVKVSVDNPNISLENPFGKAEKTIFTIQFEEEQSHNSKFFEPLVQVVPKIEIHNELVNLIKLIGKEMYYQLDPYNQVLCGLNGDKPDVIWTSTEVGHTVPEVLWEVSLTTMKNDLNKVNHYIKLTEKYAIVFGSEKDKEKFREELKRYRSFKWQNEKLILLSTLELKELYNFVVLIKEKISSFNKLGLERQLSDMFVKLFGDIYP